MDYGILFLESGYLLLPLVGLALALTCVFFLGRHHEPNYMSRLPPGPYAWELVGSMFMSPQALFTHFTQKYGPLFSLRMGRLLCVVASCPEPIMEIFKIQDNIFSGRYVPSLCCRIPHSDQTSVLCAKECNDTWKTSRAMCNRWLFSTKAMELRNEVRKKKLVEMMNYMHMKDGEIVNQRNVIFTTLANSMSNMLVSSDITNFTLECEHDGGNRGLNGLVKGIVKTLGAPSMFDFFSSLKHGPLGLLEKGKAIKLHKKFKSLWGRFIQERRVANQPSQDLLDDLIQSGLCEDAIYTSLMEMFRASVHTTCSTIEWLMAELIKNQRVMFKILAEVEEVIVNGDIEKATSSGMHYLQACLREALRLHPPGLFVVPHCALETCTVNNYIIPKDFILLINNWTMGRDPSTWDEPLKFKPERFLESTSRQNIQFGSLPFGFGRRMCPGVGLATTHVLGIVAILVHYFDWIIPQGMDINMSETLGVLVCMKEPLKLIPRSRSR